MAAGEQKVLMSNLVAKATEEVIKNGNVRIGYLRRTGCLLRFTKSKLGSEIKPQGVKSKFIMPDSYTCDDANDNTNNNSNKYYLAPVKITTPENEFLNVHDMDIFENITVALGSIEVQEENHVCDLFSEEELREVGVCESDDEISACFA